MLAVRDKSIIQIEVTNACKHECTNCSRFVGHYRSIYFMKLEQVEKAIDSLLDFPGGIGIMGGEPLMHPDFLEICRLMRQKVSPDRRRLWTSGYNWNMYRDVVRKTFGGKVRFNKHNDTTQKHHSMLLSISDIIHDQELIRHLLDDCWVNRRWSASINPKGAFFCEIAAAMDMLFEGNGGHPVERGWWDKNPEVFQDQMELYCYRCGACVPFFPITLEEKDVASTSNYQRLQQLESPKLLKKGIELFEEELSQQQLEEFARQWQPWNHWGKRDEERQGKGGYEFYGKMYGNYFRLKRNFRPRSWIFRSANQVVVRELWKLKKKMGCGTK
jgi:Radical SAM superfamily/4Fe-4S single cluster domain